MSSPRTGPTVVVEHVSKWFDGVVAVNDVSLEVGPGVTGLLGANGAGKSTLLRAIAGLTEPSDGTIAVFGEQPRTRPDLYRRIGVMTEHDVAYDFLSARRFVALNAQLQGLPDVEDAAQRALAAVGLLEHRDTPIAEYSHGMRQRARLAATIVHDPELLILDEPLSGIDPRQRLRLGELIRGLGAEGRTIIVSSHILDEVEALADRVHLMVAGKLAASGSPRAIRRKLNDRPFVVRVDAGDPRRLGAGLLAERAVESVEVDESGIRVRGTDVASLQLAIPRVARELDVRVTRVEPLDDSLESVFEYLARG
jgi:ABC-2 type transport system ATP-binding protein